MKTITFAKTKGGTGSTTLCYNVAFHASEEGRTPVSLIDRDPQGSLTKMWVARSELFKPKIIYDVESVAQTVRFLNGADYDAEFLFVDAPGSMIPIIEDAIISSDLIVAATRPSPLDIWAQDELIDLIEKSNLSHRLLFVLTHAQSVKGAVDLVEKARKHLRRYSPNPIPLMPYRIDYMRAPENGRPAWEVSKNREIKTEIEDIWSAMLKTMKKASSATSEVGNVIQLAR